MAAAWFNRLALPNKARAISAGTERGSQVHPEVVAVMAQVGIDLSTGRPAYRSEDLARSASLLVTMGCGDACPAVPGLLREDWPLEDPKGSRWNACVRFATTFAAESRLIVRNRWT